MKNRREFIRKFAAGGLALAASNKVAIGKEVYELNSNLLPHRSFSANNQINLALIGVGIQGFSNARAAVQVPGIKIVAACDLYSGRLIRAQELYGKEVKVTKDYREILQMEEVDAVCISTTDHWHDHITIAALKAGKAVYCEKPMVHQLEEGLAVVDAEKKYGLPLQVGSQRVSSILTEKAAELFAQGWIGELNLVEISADRASSGGAWQYSIPTDAGPDTVDWESYIGDAPKVPYDSNRFFRWRNYQDYGTGIAGDLFVHSFSSLHAITGSLGPERIFGTGGLRFWKDGRDVPDITLGLYDYPATEKHPAFNVQMRVSFVDGSRSPSVMRLVGTEGVIDLKNSSVILKRTKVSTQPTYGGWDSFDTFSEAQQKDFERWFAAQNGTPRATVQEPEEIIYTSPKGYSNHVDHWAYFAESIRNGTALLEDSAFGLRAAGPSLATNDSLFEKKIIHWDPIGMKKI